MNLIINVGLFQHRIVAEKTNYKRTRASDKKKTSKKWTLNMNQNRWTYRRAQSAQSANRTAMKSFQRQLNWLFILICMLGVVVFFSFRFVVIA